MRKPTSEFNWQVLWPPWSIQHVMTVQSDVNPTLPSILMSVFCISCRWQLNSTCAKTSNLNWDTFWTKKIDNTFHFFVDWNWQEGGGIVMVSFSSRNWVMPKIAENVCVSARFQLKGPWCHIQKPPPCPELHPCPSTKSLLESPLNHLYLLCLRSRIWTDFSVKNTLTRYSYRTFKLPHIHWISTMYTIQLPKIYHLCK